MIHCISIYFVLFYFILFHIERTDLQAAFVQGVLTSEKLSSTYACNIATLQDSMATQDIKNLASLQVVRTVNVNVCY